MIFLLVLSSIAAASMIIPANENAQENAQAPEKSPAIGENWDLERVDFIHYAKPDGAGKPDKPDKPPKGTTCYELMGVKWKDAPVQYAINPSNPQGLDETLIVNATAISAETWDSATSTDLFGNVNVDYSAVYGVQNFNNDIDFGNLDAGTIGVTSVWYTRKGKEIVEFDMRLNTDYMWGNTDITPGYMDIQNIVTHELGHAVGLRDLYTNACSSVTMYGYSGYNETSKRSLEQADITGLQRMYG